MKIFTKVAQLSSFTRTAETLGLPKASVSAAIQDLEAHLGVRLLHRTTRKVHITQDGAVFLERSHDLLSEFEATESMFRKQGPMLSGRLRVDLPNVIARRIIIPHLPAFFAAYPHIDLELSSTDRLVDVVQEGFDCVLRIGHLNQTGLIARPLGALRLINAASPEYLRTWGIPRSIDDLPRHRLIHYSSAFGSRTIGFEYLHDGRYLEVAMPGPLTVNNSEAYVTAARHGLGIIQAPISGLRAFLQEGSLVEILPELTSEPMPMNLIYPHRRNLSPRVRVFMDWVSKLVREDESQVAAQ